MTIVGETLAGGMAVATQQKTEHDVMDLLCMPQVLVDLVEACLEGDDEQSLAEIILRDAALSAKIILTASKTDSNLLDPLEPVSSAIQQLGIPILTGIALQSAQQIVQHRFTPQELSFQFGLWFTSQASGLVARCLAPTVNYPYIEEAQLCGLLQNLGIYALFSREGSEYLDLDVKPWSTAIQSHLEEVHFQIDHLQIAEKLIGQWQLDSFLVDSIRFLHADIGQIEYSNPLFKIARLVQQFSLNPMDLVAETEALAERLFGFNKTEVEYLLEWVRGLYPDFGNFLDNDEKLQDEMAVILARLTELSFMLADQEAARARFGRVRKPNELVQIARHLYLENSLASEAIFFLLDSRNHQLTGILTENQPRLVGELKVSLEAQSSLPATALLSGQATDSFQSLQPLTVTDHLLIRLAKGHGISCHPFFYKGRALGVVVLGIDSNKDLQQLQGIRIKMFGQVISAAMMKMSVDSEDYVNEGSSLLRRVSHEVKNPLTIIGNYAEVLNHSLANSKSQELTQSIKKEVRRIDDILSYYLNRQEIPGFPEPSIDLNQLVLDTVDASRDVMLKPRRIETRFDLQNNLENVATNPVLVKQILINLLKNAAEAVCDGGVIQLITRGGYSSDYGRHIEVIVQDNGPGIPAELQERLFQPIATTKGASRGGVGLNIVKGMVNDLGGRISCHSTADAGTSFHLQIPCKIEHPEES